MRARACPTVPLPRFAPRVLAAFGVMVVTGSDAGTQGSGNGKRPHTHHPWCLVQLHTPCHPCPAPISSPGPLGNVGGSSGENPGWGPSVGGCWLPGNVTVTDPGWQAVSTEAPRPPPPEARAPPAPLACSACRSPTCTQRLSSWEPPYPLLISLLSSLSSMQCSLFEKVIRGEMAHYSVER